MNFEEIEAIPNYRKSLILYFLIMYVVGNFITLGLQFILFATTEVDMELYLEIIASNDYAHYLTIYPELTINIIKMLAASNFFIFLILIVVLSLILKKQLLIDIKNVLNIDNKIDILKTFIISFSIFYILSILSNLFFDLLNKLVDVDISFNQEFIELALDKAPFMMVISTVLLGPIIEEYVFRKSIFGLFSNKKIALLVSTISFGVIHIISSITLGFNFIQLLVLLLPYLFAGGLLGVIYMKTKCNLFYVTLIHIVSNLISVIVILLS